MKIAMTGGTGFVGTALKRVFEAQGWEVLLLERATLALAPDQLASQLEGVEVVVNLAGANIAQRWDRAYKKLLYTSRIHTTHTLVQAFSHMSTRPKRLLSTSAAGIYDEVGEHTEEDHRFAIDYLGLICRDWEREALEAQALGIGVSILRFGVVLGKGGGALQKMLLPFKLGLGGPIGNGKQPFSWIHLNDLCRAYLFVLDSPERTGVYNLTAPHPITNAEFTKALGSVLSRPTLLPLPPLVLKLLYGEGADVLTVGQRALPERLTKEHFIFDYPDIHSALKEILA